MIFLERFQRCLFILISWKYAESQWDSISVGKESHLHDRVWPVLFGIPVLLVPVRLLDLKEIIRAVIKKDAGIALLDRTAVLVDLSLDKI